jgi:hypothetical protein
VTQTRTPAPERFFLQPVPLPEFSTCLLGLLCIQYWAGIVAILGGSSSIDGVLNAFTQISVLPVIEWYVLFGLTGRLGQQTVSPALAFGSLALIAMTSVIVTHQRFAFLSETFVLLVAWRKTPGLRRVALILFIIALQHGQEITPLHGFVGWLDARMVSGLMSAIGHPVIRTGNLLISPGMPGGLVVLTGCASSNLMISMGLGLAVLLLASRDRLNRGDYYWIGATLAIAVTMNIARLALMLQSHDAYLSWHKGTGASVVSVVGLIVTLAAWMAATRRTEVGT